MRIGSLFSGYMGLDLAVEEFYGARTVWCSDIDPGACKIIAHRMPDIPNLGDITAVDWAAVEPVDILCGGWPCQPFSLAGKRKGAADERALWPFVAGAVRALRPRHIVLENVAAIATAGELARASADLAALGYVGQWRCLRAADVGAPHGRARIFITAWDTSRGHGWGAVSGVRLRSGQESSRGSGDRAAADTAIGRGSVTSGDGGRVSDVAWIPDLRDQDTVADADSLGRQRDGRARDGRPGSTDGSLAATDAASDGRQQGWPEPARLIGGPDAAQRSDASTDTGGDGRGARAGLDEQSGEGFAVGTRRRGAIAWGAYEPAIRRWERLLGREAPAPTETSPKGSQRLSPAFVEWMMGLPAGWVCDVPGLTRNEQLKALGNGVVPQQALAALRIMASLEAAA